MKNTKEVVTTVKEIDVYSICTKIMREGKTIVFNPMKKATREVVISLRDKLISNNTEEKIIENGNTEITKDLNTREFQIYNYFCECITKGFLNIGYQFGIAKFNKLFINWENGKSTEKSNVLPTVTNISNACKYFYKFNGEKCGFFPIIRTNHDDVTIIDFVAYEPNFYFSSNSANSSTEKKTISHENAVKKLCKLVNSISELMNSSDLQNSDILEALNAIPNFQNSNLENAANQ